MLPCISILSVEHHDFVDLGRWPRPSSDRRFGLRSLCDVRARAYERNRSRIDALCQVQSHGHSQVLQHAHRSRDCADQAHLCVRGSLLATVSYAHWIPWRSACPGMCGTDAAPLTPTSASHCRATSSAVRRQIPHFGTKVVHAGNGPCGLTCKVQNCLRRELSFTDGLNRNAVGLRGPQRSSRT